MDVTNKDAAAIAAELAARNEKIHATTTMRNSSKKGSKKGSAAGPLSTKDPSTKGKGKKGGAIKKGEPTTSPQKTSPQKIKGVATKNATGKAGPEKTRLTTTAKGGPPSVSSKGPEKAASPGPKVPPQSAEKGITPKKDPKATPLKRAPGSSPSKSSPSKPALLKSESSLVTTTTTTVLSGGLSQQQTVVKQAVGSNELAKTAPSATTAITENKAPASSSSEKEKTPEVGPKLQGAWAKAASVVASVISPKQTASSQSSSLGGPTSSKTARVWGPVPTAKSCEASLPISGTQIAADNKVEQKNSTGTVVNQAEKKIRQEELQEGVKLQGAWAAKNL